MMSKKTRNVLGLLALIFSVSAQASPWSEIESQSVIELKKDLAIDANLTLKSGSRFAVNEVEVLGATSVEAISMRLFPCTPALSTQKAPLTLLDDQYGFEMDLNCSITFYLEMKDYYLESYFNSVAP
jgi:hypothetical protein